MSVLKTDIDQAITKVLQAKEKVDQCHDWSCFEGSDGPALQALLSAVDYMRVVRDRLSVAGYVHQPCLDPRLKDLKKLPQRDRGPGGLLDPNS